MLPWRVGDSTTERCWDWSMEGSCNKPVSTPEQTPMHRHTFTFCILSLGFLRTSWTRHHWEQRTNILQTYPYIIWISSLCDSGAQSFDLPCLQTQDATCYVRLLSGEGTSRPKATVFLWTVLKQALFTLVYRGERFVSNSGWGKKRTSPGR